ncbi:hypothetical protein ACFX11_040113 [Malus domestica]
MTAANRDRRRGEGEKKGIANLQSLYERALGLLRGSESSAIPAGVERRALFRFDLDRSKNVQEHVSIRFSVHSIQPREQAFADLG